MWYAFKISKKIFYNKKYCQEQWAIFIGRDNIWGGINDNESFIVIHVI